MTVVPIGENARRLPQAGRIRIGIKDKSKQGRRAINTFRLTSQDDSYLRAVASVYGGDVRPWADAKSPDRWELITQTNKMQVVLPPNPLSEWFELWTGGKGLERRCTGKRCDQLIDGHDGPERVEVPCICNRQGYLECKYKLRLSVILPEVSTLSTWRLDTSSENARAEIPGVVDIIESVQGQGLHVATLRLEQRTSPGHRFNVPILDIGMSYSELMAGQTTRLAELPESPLAIAPADDDVIEAEVVVDDITGPVTIDPTFGRAWLDSLTTHQKARVLIRSRELALDMGEELPTNLRTISPALLDRLMEEESHL
jgi:hypothetical protein